MTNEMGKRIKQLRKQYKYTQRQVADFLDISQSLLAKVESGERNLKITKLTRLCDVYNCSIEYLVYGEGEPIDAPHFTKGKGLSLETLGKMNKILRNLDEMAKLAEENGI